MTLKTIIMHDGPRIMDTRYRHNDIETIIMYNCYMRHKYKVNCVGLAFAISTLFDFASSFWRHLIIQLLNFRIAQVIFVNTSPNIDWLGTCQLY